MKKEKSIDGKKVWLLLVLGFGVNLFFSCVPTEYIKINYNKISLTGVDNSGKYLLDNPTSTIHASALALNIKLSDTTYFNETYSLNHLINSLSFNKAQAFQPADPVYIPTAKIIDVNVKTILKINDNINPNDDITEHILYSFGGSYNLYYNLNKETEKITPKFENSNYNNSPSNSIFLILKPTIENTNAQFEVKITLDNGTELIATTELFNIYN